MAHETTPHPPTSTAPPIPLSMPPPIIDKRLLDILVCPVTRGPLRWDPAAQELLSLQAELAYPVRDGIPIMLPEEARPFGPNDPQRGHDV